MTPAAGSRHGRGLGFLDQDARPAAAGGHPAADATPADWRPCRSQTPGEHRDRAGSGGNGVQSGLDRSWSCTPGAGPSAGGPGRLQRAWTAFRATARRCSEVSFRARAWPPSLPEAAKTARPALDGLLAAARSRQVDLVVCTKLDRRARSTHHLVTLANELEALGADRVVLDQAIDTTTPSERLLFHVLAAIAELERDLIGSEIGSWPAFAGPRPRAGSSAFRRYLVDVTQAQALLSQLSSRGGRVSYTLPETYRAPAVCCSAWFGVPSLRPPRLGVDLLA